MRASLESSKGPRAVIPLFLIGVVMGICDLIPGVSGGTIAYLSGIYPEFLAAIESLSLSWRTVQWRFLLSLGLGILTAVVLFSHLVYYLLQVHTPLLYAFFFGIVATSSVQNMRQRRVRWKALIAGIACALMLTSLPLTSALSFPFWWLFLSGMLGAGAMLLPGISGSCMLQILGVYPIFIQALVQINLAVLLVTALGIATGCFLFSRGARIILTRYPDQTHAFLTGCMIGGLRILWPFSAESFITPSLIMVIGIIFALLLEWKGGVALLRSKG